MDGTQHYMIPVGLFYTGAMQQLFFAMDNDADPQNGNSIFSNVIIYESTATAAALNLNSYTINYFDTANQGTDGTVTVSPDGSSIGLNGNAWRAINFSYTVTANTVLEFDFSSTAQAEVHTIGLDDDDTVDAVHVFDLYGTQYWGNTSFHNYSSLDGTRHYIIPIGLYYTGVMQQLFFATDNDAYPQEGNSVFSNIAVYESVQSGGSGVQTSTETMVYYYHTDHLGTPQSMTDSLQQIVWKANYSPFGEADITVDTVTNNLRFPGQYFDQETNLHYNYFRYYDPATGRYITSDPIGIVGGLNTYIYVGANPVLYTDPNGLKTYRCTKPLDAVTKKYGKGVSKWAHDNVPAAYHQYSCVVDASGTTCGGQDRGEKDEDGKRKGKKSRDNKDAGECEETQPDNKCFEDCLKKKWDGSRPNYGIPFGTDCQEYDDNVNQTCRTECGL